MVKLLIIVLLAVLFCVTTSSVARAQTALEYGIIGSKTPTKSPEALGKIENKVETGSQRSTCSSGVCKSKQTNKSTTVGKVKEPRIIEKRGGQNAKESGPLIIEKRGDHYERIN